MLEMLRQYDPEWAAKEEAKLLANRREQEMKRNEEIKASSTQEDYAKYLFYQCGFGETFDPQKAQEYIQRAEEMMQGIGNN